MATMKKTELQKKLINQDFQKGEELEKRAEGEKDVSTKAQLYQDAAARYQLSNSLKKAAEALYKSANCYKKIKKIKEAAEMYMNSGRIYWMIYDPEAVSCFNLATDHFLESHKISLAASYCREVGSLYEQTSDYEKSMTYFLRSADLYSCILDWGNRNKSQHRAKQVADKLKWMKACTRFEKFLVKCLKWAKHNT